MARPSKPWFRKSSQTWCTKIMGRQYTLARGLHAKQEALQEFYHLMTLKTETLEAGQHDVSLEWMINKFMDHVEETVCPDRYRNYVRYLGYWADFAGRDSWATTIRPIDIDRFFEKFDEDRRKRGRPPWSSSTKQMALDMIKHSYRWAVRQDLIPASPLKDARGPGFERRDVTLSGDDMARILKATEGHLIHDLIEFMWETGCRPSEAYKLEASHVNLAEGIATFPGKTTKKTKKPRVLYFTPRAKEIVAAALAEHPSGPVFRNRDGGGWTYRAASSVFTRLREKLGLGSDCTPVGIRHGYATDGALKLQPMVLARLMGHASTHMIQHHYVDLSRRKAEMIDAAATVRCDASSVSPSEET